MTNRHAPRRKPRTHFPQVPVAVARRAAALASDGADPSNVIVEGASAKTEPYYEPPRRNVRRAR